MNIFNSSVSYFIIVIPTIISLLSLFYPEKKETVQVTKGQKFYEVSKKKPWVKFVTMSLMLLVVIFSCLKTHNDSKHNSDLKDQLHDIKVAMQTANIKWDSVTNNITPINIEYLEGAVVTGGHASNNTMDNVTILYSPPHYVDMATGKNINFKEFSEPQLKGMLQGIDEMIKKTKRNTVALFALDTALQKDKIKQLRDALLLRGIKAPMIGLWNPEPPLFRYKNYVMPKDGYVGVFLGTD